jgi:hypothetical protein
MAFLNGIHLIAALASDIDRLIDFCARVFDARLLLDIGEKGFDWVVGPGRTKRAPALYRSP